ncbi:MAG: hypothetical protein ACRC2I_03110 [Plesiomonas shigelloides]
MIDFNSIDHAIALIQKDPEQANAIAGEYAYQMAREAYEIASESGFGMEDEDFEDQLEFLINAGLVFDVQEAINKARSLHIANQSSC